MVALCDIPLDALSFLVLQSVHAQRHRCEQFNSQYRMIIPFSMFTCRTLSLTTAICANVFYFGRLQFNSWFSIAWPFWPRIAAKPAPLTVLLQRLTPWRLVHAYGVFPPFTTAPVRMAVVFEGSRDGVEWKECT
jgi:hypothetical protein